MDEFYTYDGVTAFDWSGNRYDVYDLIARGIDVVGAATSNSPYVSPDDPRYRNRGGGWFPQPLPNQTRTNTGDFIPGAVNDRGFQLNWWSAALIGVVVGAFLLGKRGR